VVLVIGGAGAQGLPIVKGISPSSPSTNCTKPLNTSRSPHRRLSQHCPSPNPQRHLPQCQSALQHAQRHPPHRLQHLRARPPFRIVIHHSRLCKPQRFRRRAESRNLLGHPDLRARRGKRGAEYFVWSALDYALRDLGYNGSLRYGHHEGKELLTE
jgi:hypothetical protein